MHHAMLSLDVNVTADADIAAYAYTDGAAAGSSLAHTHVYSCIPRAYF